MFVCMTCFSHQWLPGVSVWWWKCLIFVYTVLSFHQSSPSLFLAVSRFVKYTGYGNAAGLLATRGLLGGQGARTLSSDGQYSSDSDSDTEEYRQVKDRINPVTGRVEAEQPDPMEGMTEEEKEEEAKRLIMLFNKLSRSVKRQRLTDIKLTLQTFAEMIQMTLNIYIFCRDHQDQVYLWNKL